MSVRSVPCLSGVSCVRVRLEETLVRAGSGKYTHLPVSACAALGVASAKVLLKALNSALYVLREKRVDSLRDSAETPATAARHGTPSGRWTR